MLENIIIIAILIFSICILTFCQEFPHHSICPEPEALLLDDPDSLCPKQIHKNSTQLKYHHHEIPINFDNFENLNRTTIEFIRSFGYSGTTYEVETEDGFILNLISVFESPKYPGRKPSKGPILLMHGFCYSGLSWFLIAEENILPFILADNSYDVYIGNFRGTSYSQNHISLAINDSQYWDFTAHELAMYDLKAKIDFILTKTGEKSITYIGHCLGATTFLILMSETPDFNTKINLSILITPFVYMKNTKAKFFTHFSKELYHNTIKPILKINQTTNEPTYHIDCKPSKDMKKIRSCSNFFYGYGDLNCPQENVEKIPLYSAGKDQTSLKIFYNLVQNYYTDSFGKFNLSIFQNVLQNLGNQTQNFADVVEYNLRKIMVKIILFSACQDAVIPPKDFWRLKGVLEETGYLIEHIVFKSYGNTNILLSDNPKENVWETIIPKLKEYEKKIKLI